MFGWSRPYPRKGEYKPYAETALRNGVFPDSEATQFYIATLRKQLEEVEANRKAQLMGRADDYTEKFTKDAQDVIDQHEKKFMESVGDWEPESWKLGEPRDPGDNDGPVAFQAGVGDSPALSKA